MLVLAACSSSSSSPPPDTDSGAVAQSDGGVDAAVAVDSSKADAAPAPENDCTVFADHTADAAMRSIQWDIFVKGVPERCIKIKAGQVVTWIDGAGVADFNAHPLVIYLPGGGAAPAVDEATGKATFAKAGLFGFACGVHPTMKGAVLVE